MMKKIEIHQERFHSKASEHYLDVKFCYEDGTFWEGSIPVEYRRTGTDLNLENYDEYLNDIYDYCHPSKHDGWLKEQESFWSDRQKKETWELFRVLKTLQWTCVSCNYDNPNWARRNQDLKELGYTISTKTSQYCEKCDKNRRTFLLLVPLPRGGISGYEVWSSETRKKIVNTLKSYDSYEGKVIKKDSLLPDHKFPEIRWDSETKRESLENLTMEEIRHDFQLLTNQRNQQKREACRNCYQTSKRGYPFGIKFFYIGSDVWDSDIPQTGKDAERGCVGCGWYDLEQWRQVLNRRIKEFGQSSD